MAVLRAVLLVVLVLGALVALLFLLPWLKEGFGIEELPLFAGIAAALLVALLGWTALHRRRRGGAFWTGAAFVALPLCLHAALAARVLVNHLRGRALARSVRIVSLAESEIRWPGIPEAVGVRMDLEVEHGIGRAGNLFAPRVIMGADPRPAYRDYFFGGLDPGVDPMLSTPLFEIGGPPRDVFARPGRARVSFDLLPSALARREGNALCLLSRASGPTGGRTAAPPGGDLGAAWFFAAGGGVIVDLSGPLTEALRKGSRLQGRPEEWSRLLKRMEPDRLEAAGLRRCAPPRAGYGEVCYCPPESGSAALE
jgi:hypothetical protein